MLDDYSPYEENKVLYDSVCKKVSTGPTLLSLIYEDFAENPFENNLQGSQNLLNEDDNHNEIIVSDAGYTKECIFNMQQALMNFDINDITQFESDFDPSLVISDKSLVLNNDTFAKICNEISDKPSSVIFMAAKLIILPKVFDSCGKLSESSCEVLQKLLTVHVEEITRGALCPLLALVPSCIEYYDLLISLTSKTPASFLVIHLIEALSSRELNEADLRLFMSLTEKVDSSNHEFNTKINDFLNRQAPKFSKSIVFGRCLLGITKNLGPYLLDKESLRLAIANHQSGMRNIIEKAYISV